MSKREQIAPVTHYKRAAVSDSLTSLFIKEQKCHLLKKWIRSYTKKSQAICSKTDERIHNPALQYSPHPYQYSPHPFQYFPYPCQYFSTTNGLYLKGQPNKIFDPHFFIFWTLILVKILSRYSNEVWYPGKSISPGYHTAVSQYPRSIVIINNRSQQKVSKVYFLIGSVNI